MRVFGVRVRVKVRVRVGEDENIWGKGEDEI